MGVYNSGYSPQNLLELPYLDRVARGLIPGASFVRKYGLVTSNNGVGYRDCWEYGSVALGNINYTYVADGAATIDTLSSSSAADTQNTVVQGLDANGNFVTQTKALDGQNKVTLDTPLSRCFRVYNDAALGTAVIGSGYAGGVYVYTDTAISGGVPVDKTKIASFVNASNNQTLQSFYTIPAGKTGYLKWSRRALVSKGSTATAGIRFWLRPYGKVFRLADSGSISGAGTSVSEVSGMLSNPIPERTDLIGRVDVDTNGTTVSMRFDILLIDNE